MKIHINRKPVIGPWGGGNKTVQCLVEKLSSMGHSIVFDLNHSDIDTVFCFDPRPNDLGIWYQTFLDYKLKVNPKLKIIQRVGDVGTHGKPELTNLVKSSVAYSDYIIFPSLWAKEYIEYSEDNFSVIRNRPLNKFHRHKKESDNLSTKIKIVTHHWSTNSKKGFGVYQVLKSRLREHGIDSEFTYIGRYPDSLSNSDINLIEAKDSDFLSRELPNHDIYFTASLEEAGANHVLEGIASGLPVVFHKGGGSIVEYCDGYGNGFSSVDDLHSSFQEVIKNFKRYKDNCMLYNCTMEDTVSEYVDLICQ